jgi:hypothetical protein
MVKRHGYGQKSDHMDVSHGTIHKSSIHPYQFLNKIVDFCLSRHNDIDR